MKNIKKTLRELNKLVKTYDEAENTILETRRNEIYYREEARKLVIVEKMKEHVEELDIILSLKQEMKYSLANSKTLELKDSITL